MKREQLIQELLKAAKQTGATFEVFENKGKGSHYRVQFGDKATTLKSGERTAGYVRLIKKQLGAERSPAFLVFIAEQQPKEGRNSMDYVYRARFERDPDGGFLATFPDVPEAITHGATMAEARASAAEALGLALRGIVAAGKPLPLAAAGGEPGTDIAVPADDALKLAVIEAFRAAGISKSELGRRLGKAETEARRILDPDHPTKLEMLSAALAVLGRMIVISVREAA